MCALARHKAPTGRRIIAQRFQRWVDAKMIWSPVGTTLSIQTRSVRCIPCRSSSRTKYILLRTSVCDDVPVGSGGIRFCRSLVLKAQCRLLFTKECAMWLHPSGVVLTGLGLFVLLYPALEPGLFT